MKALIVTLLPSFIQRSFASCFDFTLLSPAVAALAALAALAAASALSSWRQQFKLF